MNNDAETLAQAVKRIRNARGLSLEDVRTQSGDKIASSYVSRIENGDIDPGAISIGRLNSLAEGLDEPIENLVFLALGWTETNEMSNLDRQLLHRAVSLTEFRKRDLLEIAEILYRSQAPTDGLGDWAIWDVTLSKIHRTRKRRSENQKGGKPKQ